MNFENANSDDFIEKILHFPELDSTNTYAKYVTELPVSGLLVIVADRQNAGRGQRENSFCSPLGGLYASIVCPLSDISRHFNLNRAISLAICDAIESICPAAVLSIKWPNDIFWSDKKLCGILLESVLRSTRHVVAGFGLNVNTKADRFPVALQPYVTSMVMQTNNTYDLKLLLHEICKRFQAYRLTDPEFLHPYYLKRLYRMGSVIVINGVRGIFHSVLEDGQLCVSTDKGLEYISSGSIEFLKT